MDSRQMDQIHQTVERNLRLRERGMSRKPSIVTRLRENTLDLRDLLGMKGTT